jgi:hypothetical protein
VHCHRYCEERVHRPEPFGFTRIKAEQVMTKMKALSAVLVLCAIIAAPVFAKDSGVSGPGSRHGLKPKPGSISHHVRVHHRRYVRGAYMQPRPNDRYDPDPEFQRNIENFGFSGRDPSRIGGEDPSLHPSQY